MLATTEFISPPEWGLLGFVVVSLLSVVWWLLRQSRADDLRAYAKADEAWKETLRIASTHTDYIKERAAAETEALRAAGEGFQTVNKSLELLNRRMEGDERRAEARHREHIEIVSMILERVGPKQDGTG